MAKKIKTFKSPAINSEDYKKMTSEEKWEYFKELSRLNKQWIVQNIPRGAHYIIVSRHGEVLLRGCSNVGTVM